MTSQLIIEVHTASRPATERARQLLSQSTSNPVWDLGSDKRFDDHSLWLVFLQGESRQFRGCAHMVFPYLDGKRQPLPLELGESPNFQLSGKEGLFCEAAGIHIAKKPGNGVQQIVGGVASWCKVAGVRHLYTTLREPKQEKAYQALGFAEIPDRKPHWPLRHLEPSAIDEVAQQQGRQYFIRHMRDVDDQLKRFRAL